MQNLNNLKSIRITKLQKQNHFAALDLGKNYIKRSMSRVKPFEVYL